MAEPRLTELGLFLSSEQPDGGDDGFDSRCSETLSEPEKFVPYTVNVLPKGPLGWEWEMAGAADTVNCVTAEEVDEVAPCRHM